MSGQFTKDEFLKTVAEHRALTMSQLVELSSVSEQMMRRRVKQMEASGVLERIYPLLPGRRGRPEAVVVVGKKGLDEISEALGRELDELIKPNQIGHEISANWFRIRLHRLTPEGFGVAYVSSSSPYSVCRDGSSRLRLSVGDHTLVPDGAFSLSSRKKSLLFFVEIDRGTESVNGKGTTISQKIGNYQHLRSGGGYRVCERLFKASFRGFRVLFVVNSSKRLKSLCKAIKAKTPSDFIWVALEEDVLKQGVGGDVWVRGGDAGKPKESILGGTKNGNDI